MKKISSIQTKRLLMRPWTQEDLIPFAKMNANPRVREYFPAVLSKEESDQEAKFIIKFSNEHGWGFWAIELPNIAPFIGFIGLENVDFSAHFTPAVEIGWRLDHEYWGQGYATEGARACLAFGFEQLHLKEIVSFTALGNLRSQRVMQKIGMHHSSNDDFDHPKVADDSKLKRHILYRISKAEWERSFKPIANWDTR